MGEKKRKPRQIPFSGAKVAVTGRSFVEILQQSPTLEGEVEVEFKEKNCAKSLDQMEWCSVGNWIGTTPPSSIWRKQGRR